MGRRPSAKTIVDRQLGRDRSIAKVSDIPQEVFMTDYSGMKEGLRKTDVFTEGSILFIGDRLQVTQDNSNLFWNVARTELEPNSIKITSDGSQAYPALKFNDMNTGFYKSGDSVRLSLNNSTKMTIDSTGVGIGVADPHSKLEVVGAISSSTATISASSDITDVSGINTLFVNATGGDVVLGGLKNGVAGQVLYIIISVPSANHLRLEQAEGIAGSQDFINHTAVDEDISHGGCVYVCNGTDWFDASHAKHV